MSQFKSSVSVTGQLDIKKINKFGIITERVHVPNLVVLTGKSYIASRIVDANTPIMGHMAVGSNSTTPIVEHTTLGNELGRAEITSAATGNNNVITYVATFPPGIGTGELQEAGIFNGPVDGIMLARTVFNVITKDVSDTITITWVITVS